MTPEELEKLFPGQFTAAQPAAPAAAPPVVPAASGAPQVAKSTEEGTAPRTKPVTLETKGVKVPKAKKVAAADAPVAEAPVVPPDVGFDLTADLKKFQRLSQGADSHVAVAVYLGPDFERRARAQAVDLKSVFDATKNGRTFDEIAQANRGRLVLGFIPPAEREAAWKATVEQFNKAEQGDAGDEIKLKASGADRPTLGGRAGGAVAGGMMGAAAGLPGAAVGAVAGAASMGSGYVAQGTTTALPEVTKPGEYGYQIAETLVRALAADKEASAIYDRYSRKMQGGATVGYIQDRVELLAKKRGLRASDPKFDEKLKSLRRQATNELIAYKTIGLWTPVILAKDVAVMEGVKAPGFLEAMSPNIELVGFDNNRQAIFRQESALGTIFRAIDIPQEMLIGASPRFGMGGAAPLDLSTRGRSAAEVWAGAKTGVMTGANFLEAALEATEDAPTPVRVVAGVAGLAASMLSPDLLGAAARAGPAAARGLLKTRNVGRSQAALKLLREAQTAYGMGDLRAAAKAEAQLRDKFVEVADLLDRNDAAAAERITVIDPEIPILDERFVAKVDAVLGQSETGAGKSILHPSQRAQELTRTRGGTETTSLTYAEKYDYTKHLDDAKKDADAIRSVQTATPDPRMERHFEAQVDEVMNEAFGRDLARGGPGSIKQAEYDAITAVLKQNLPSFYADPRQWQRSLQAAFARNPTTMALPGTMRQGVYRQVAPRMARRFANTMDIADKLEAAAKANVDARGLAHEYTATLLAKDLKKAHPKVQVTPVELYTDVALKSSVTGKPAVLSELGKAYLILLRRAQPKADFEVLYAQAIYADNMAHSWAKGTTADPFRYFETVEGKFPRGGAGPEFEAGGKPPAAPTKPTAPTAPATPPTTPIPTPTPTPTPRPVPVPPPAAVTPPAPVAPPAVPPAAVTPPAPKPVAPVVAPTPAKPVAPAVVIGPPTGTFTPEFAEATFKDYVGVQRPDGSFVFGRPAAGQLFDAHFGDGSREGYPQFVSWLESKVDSPAPDMTSRYAVKPGDRSVPFQPGLIASEWQKILGAKKPVAPVAPVAAPVVRLAPEAKAQIAKLEDELDAVREAGSDADMLRAGEIEMEIESIRQGAPVEPTPAAPAAPAAAKKYFDPYPVPKAGPPPKAYQSLPNKGNEYEMPWTAYLSGKDSPEIRAKAAERGDIGLLVTPGTASYLNKAGAYPVFAVDNGVFGKEGFNPAKFNELVDKLGQAPQAIKDKLLYVVAPDVLIKLPDGKVVGDAKGTLEQFKTWGPQIRAKGLPVAFVAQNGLEDMIDEVPWGQFDVLFIGGSDDWKVGNLVGEQKVKWDRLFDAFRDHGVPIHMGRVSGPERLSKAAHDVGAATVDGTMLAVAPTQMMAKLENMLDRLNKDGANAADYIYPEVGYFPDTVDMITAARDPRVTSPETLFSVYPGIEPQEMTGFVLRAKAERRRVWNEIVSARAAENDPKLPKLEEKQLKPTSTAFTPAGAPTLDQVAIDLRRAREAKAPVPPTPTPAAAPTPNRYAGLELQNKSSEVARTLRAMPEALRRFRGHEQLLLALSLNRVSPEQIDALRALDNNGMLRLINAMNPPGTTVEKALAQVVATPVAAPKAAEAAAEAPKLAPANAALLARVRDVQARLAARGTPSSLSEADLAGLETMLGKGGDTEAIARGTLEGEISTAQQGLKTFEWLDEVPAAAAAPTPKPAAVEAPTPKPVEAAPAAVAPGARASTESVAALEAKLRPLVSKRFQAGYQADVAASLSQVIRELPQEYVDNLVRSLDDGSFDDWKGMQDQGGEPSAVLFALRQRSNSDLDALQRAHGATPEETFRNYYDLDYRKLRDSLRSARMGGLPDVVRELLSPKKGIIPRVSGLVQDYQFPKDLVQRLNELDTDQLADVLLLSQARAKMGERLPDVVREVLDAPLPAKQDVAKALLGSGQPFKAAADATGLKQAEVKKLAAAVKAEARRAPEAAVPTPEAAPVAKAGAEDMAEEADVLSPEQAKKEGKAPIEVSEDDLKSTLGKFLFGQEDPWNNPFMPAEKTKVIPRSTPEIPQAEASAKIESWKAEARRQGREGKNNGKVVLSLFDASGEWSRPWREAGYTVYQFDIQRGDDIRKFSADFLADQFGDFENDVFAILAAPPCTNFSGAGARWWTRMDAAGETKVGIELVDQTLSVIERYKPAVWALENPAGRIKALTGLPEPTLSFNPHNFGNPYTKRTLLWGSFDPELPLANVFPVEGSRIHKLSGKDKFGRSLTPEGFAYAFFMANNAESMGAAKAISREMRGVPEDLVQKALDAGHKAEDIKYNIEDAFFMEQSPDGVRAILDDLVANPVAKAEPVVEAPRVEAPRVEAPAPKVETRREKLARVYTKVHDDMVGSMEQAAKADWTETKNAPENQASWHYKNMPRYTTSQGRLEFIIDAARSRKRNESSVMYEVLVRVGDPIAKGEEQHWIGAPRRYATLEEAKQAIASDTVLREGAAYLVLDDIERANLVRETIKAAQPTPEAVARALTEVEQAEIARLETQLDEAYKAENDAEIDRLEAEIAKVESGGVETSAVPPELDFSAMTAEQIANLDVDQVPAEVALPGARLVRKDDGEWFDPRLPKASVDKVEGLQFIQRPRQGRSALEMARLLSESGGDLAKAIGMLADTTTVPAYQTVARRLLELEDELRQVPVDVIRPGHPDVARFFESGAPLGRYDSNANRVQLLGPEYASGGMSEEALLHEALHAVTAKRLGYDAISFSRQAELTSASVAAIEAARGEVRVVSKALMQHIARAEAAGTATAFETSPAMKNYILRFNGDELISWALTNPGFQDYLKSVKLPAQQGSLWDRFVRAMATLLGFEAEETSALAQVLAVSDRLLKTPYDTPTAGQIVTTNAVFGSLDRLTDAAIAAASRGYNAAAFRLEVPRATRRAFVDTIYMMRFGATDSASLSRDPASRLYRAQSRGGGDYAGSLREAFDNGDFAEARKLADELEVSQRAKLEMLLANIPDDVVPARFPTLLNPPTSTHAFIKADFDKTLARNREVIDALTGPAEKAAPTEFRSLRRDAANVDIDRAAKDRQVTAMINRLHGIAPTVEWEEIPERLRVAARSRLTKAEEGLNAAADAPNKITQAKYNELVADVTADLNDQDALMRARRATAPRRRGADWVRSRLLKYKDEGLIDEAGAEMADWFIQQNPQLANDMGIGVKGGEALDQTAGVYEPTNRIVKLFKESGNEETVVHEILHHTERMLPGDLQAAVTKEWRKRIGDELKTATTPEQKTFLQNALLAREPKKVLDDVTEGRVPAAYYQYVNPSEFWAMNASRIVSGRYAAFNAGMVQKAKRWLSEFIQKAKSVFGLQSDAPIIRGLDTVMKGDGTFVSNRMIADAEQYRAINTQAPTPSNITEAMDAQDDLRQLDPTTGQVKGRLGTSQKTGRYVVTLFRNADPSTALHEMAHIVRRTHLDSDQMQSVVDYAQVNGITVGHQYGEFTGAPDEIIKAEELFAQAFERYVIDGVTPNPNVQTAFDRLQGPIAQVYQGIRSSPLGAQLDPEMTRLFDQVVSTRKTTEQPTLPEAIYYQAEAARRPQTEGPLTAVSREANRLGLKAGFSPEDLAEKLKASLDANNGDPRLSKITLPAGAKIFGKNEWTAEELGQFGERLAQEASEAVMRAEGIGVDLSRRGGGVVIQEKAPVERIRSALTPRAGDTETQKYAKDAGRRFVGTFFGGDAIGESLESGGLGLRDVPVELRRDINAATRNIEQGIGDTVSVLNDVLVHGNEREVYDFLGGKNSVKLSNGRAVYSSGYDMAGAVNRMIGNVYRTLNPEKQEGLLLLADAVNSRLQGKALSETGYLVPRQVIDAEADAIHMASIQAKETSLGRSLTAAERAALYRPLTNREEGLLRAREWEVAQKKMQEGADSFLKWQGTEKGELPLMSAIRNALGFDKVVRPQQEYAAVEAMLYVSGITPRNGAMFSGSSADAAEILLRRLREVYTSDSDAMQGEQVARQVAALIGAYGQADRSKHLLAGLGLAVDKPTRDAFVGFMDKFQVPAGDRPRVERMLARFGQNPALVSDTVLGADMYIPQIARDRIAQSLGKAVFVGQADNDVMAMTYRYMKTRMTRGSIVLRQRYFTANTVDHFLQMAVIAGYGPALQSVSRVMAQNIMVAPYMSQAIAILQRSLVGRVLQKTKFGRHYFGPDVLEKIRGLLSKGGDWMAWAIGTMCNSAKYRIEVNPILEGIDGSFVSGDRVYSYKEIRNIAVEEGIFASFQTRELQKAILKEGQIIADTNGVRVVGASKAGIISSTLEPLMEDVRNIAEAWAERERLGAMVTLMEQGFDPRVAARLTIDALYDYSTTMTKMDRNWLVSVIFPFWAFQKNANQAVFNLALSPEGAYRMMCIQRARVRGTELLTELLYDEVGDDYGVDVQSMPPTLQASYYAIITRVEKAYPDGVPLDVKMAMRLLLSGRPADIYGGKEVGVSAAILTMRESGAFGGLSEFEPFAVPRPEKSALPSYLRDRPGIAVTPERNELTRFYYSLVKSNDHSYIELFLPETFIEAGMRHITYVAASYVILASKVGGAVGLISPESGIKEVNWFATVQPILDIERSPILGPLLSEYAGGVSYPKRISPFAAKTTMAGGKVLADGMAMVHPMLGKMIDDMFGTMFVRVPEVGDPIAMAVANGTDIREIAKERLDEIRALQEQHPDAAVLRKQRYYLPGGVWSTIFENLPIGELNAFMLRRETSEMEKLSFSTEMVGWARRNLGLDAVEISGTRTARSEEPTKLKSTKEM